MACIYKLFFLRQPHCMLTPEEMFLGNFSFDILCNNLTLNNATGGNILDCIGWNIACWLVLPIFLGLPSVPSNGWIWAVLLLCVFRILCFVTQRNGRFSNQIYDQIHGCGRRVSSSCSFDHLSSSQMRQHGVIGSASKDAQSDNCLYPYPYP